MLICDECGHSFDCDDMFIDGETGAKFCYPCYEKLSRNTVLRKAIAHYGEPAQVLKAIEELAELSEALVFTLNGDNRENIQYENIAFDMAVTKTACKTATLKNTEVTHDGELRHRIATEIADVIIMCEQLQSEKMFDIEKEVQEQIDFKVKRLDQRIKGESK